jgi:hypothetical protein
MKSQVTYLPAKARGTVTTLPLTDAERMFLLHRLGAVSSVVEAILHPDVPLQMRPQWTRQQMVDHAWTLIRVLRAKPYVLLLSRIDRRLLVEAIEGNTYFMRPAGDPRIKLEYIRQAEALRRKMELAVGSRVRRFKIGLGDAA